MREYFENRKNEVALRRFAAVSFIEQKLREGFGLVEAIRLAALRPWPDENGRYSARAPFAPNVCVRQRSDPASAASHRSRAEVRARQMLFSRC
jgi:hypothetical protein